MEQLKDSYLKIGIELGEEFDSNEFKCSRIENIKELGEDFDDNSLFKILSLKDMDIIDIDDKVVMIFNIDKYDIKKYEKKLGKRGLTAAELNIDNFTDIIFTKIKELLVKGLEYAKALAQEKFDEFFDKATEALGKFLKEQGTKLLEKIIEKLRGGKTPEEITVKVDGVKMSLTDALPAEDIEKIEKLAVDVDAVYDEAFKKVKENVDKVNNGEEPEDIVYIKKEEKKKLRFCCF